jgi:hypothetical protein
MDRPARIVDNPTVREVYSNRIASASYDGAVVAVSLACLRSVGERVGEKADDNQAVINNRWCIPEAVAVELHEILGAAIAKMLERKAETTSAKPPRVRKRPIRNLLTRKS